MGKVCIIRWALSENQEHLELGLQILATDAVPAFGTTESGEKTLPEAIRLCLSFPELRRYAQAKCWLRLPVLWKATPETLF